MNSGTVSCPSSNLIPSIATTTAMPTPSQANTDRGGWHSQRQVISDADTATHPYQSKNQQRTKDAGGAGCDSNEQPVASQLLCQFFRVMSGCSDKRGTEKPMVTKV